MGNVSAPCYSEEEEALPITTPTLLKTHTQIDTHTQTGDLSLYTYPCCTHVQHVQNKLIFIYIMLTERSDIL